MRRYLALGSAWFNRWPRRLATLACLVLAGTSAFGPHRPARTQSPDVHTSLSELAPGQVATSITTDVDVTAFVHPGDRVDVLAGPTDPFADGSTAPVAPGDATVVARGARVLAVVAARGTSVDDGATQLVLATDRATAPRLAGTGSRRVVALVGHSP